jgi:hypothetical protein
MSPGGFFQWGPRYTWPIVIVPMHGIFFSLNHSRQKEDLLEFLAESKRQGSGAGAALV